MHDKYYHFSTYIALVLDLSVPVVVEDVVGNVVGDLGDGMELLDALLGVELLPKVGWMEKKETSSSCFVQSHEKRSRHAVVGLNSALQFCLRLV